MYPREREERELKNRVFSEASCSSQDWTSAVPWSQWRVRPIFIAAGVNGALGQSRQKRKKEVT